VGDVRRAGISFVVDIHIRYMMSMAVSDHSGQAWLQGFNEVGVAVFGISADEMHALKVRSHLGAHNVADPTYANKTPQKMTGRR
jgi:hypothetical protein